MAYGRWCSLRVHNRRVSPTLAKGLVPLAYAFLVLLVINSLGWFLAGYFGYRLYAQLTDALPTMIDDSISRQDSRIERRLERRDNKDPTPTQQDDIGPAPPQDGVLRAGVPWRR